MLNGRCAECDVTSIICRYSHYCTAPVWTLIRDGRVLRETIASYTMAMLNTIYDTPTCSPVDDGSRCSLQSKLIQLRPL